MKDECFVSLLLPFCKEYGTDYIIANLGLQIKYYP